MTSVNKNNEEIITEIRKEIEKKYSKKFTNEEILNKCLKFSKTHIEELVKEKKKFQEPVSVKIKRILSNAQEYQLYDVDKSDDELIYVFSNN
jgi:hypothetical protein